MGVGGAGGICPVVVKEMGQVLAEWHALTPAHGLLSSNKHAVIMPSHQNDLGKTLLPVSIVTPPLHLLGNTLEDVSNSMPYLGPMLDVFLTPDATEFLYFPKLLFASPCLAVGADKLCSSKVCEIAH